MKTPHLHVDTERMQALLDGELSPAEAAVVRASIEGCARCTSEFEAWEMLFGDLDELDTLAPSSGFEDRVIEAVPSRRPGFLGTRAAARSAATHVSGERLQEYLDGGLAARVTAQVDRHLDGCRLCREELAAFRAVARSLEGLPSYAPSVDFAERVMAEVRINEMAAVAMAPTSQSARLLDRVRGWIPSSRQGWAAALGASVAPALTLLLVVQSVFSHELVTFGNLFAFVRLQMSGFFGAVGEAGTALARQWAPSMLLDGLTWVGSSPTLLAASGALASVAFLGSVWVLYRNLFTPALDELGDARLSF